MAKMSGVCFRGRNFWVYDVVGGIFLWHLVDAAKTYNFEKRLQWLDDCIPKWQIAAAIPDLAFFADDRWTEEQVDLIIRLSQKAITKILAHGDFTDVEVLSLELIDDLKLHVRGMKTIPCVPISRFGEAFMHLLLDELPAPPHKTWWYYGMAEQPETMSMQVNWDELEIT